MYQITKGDIEFTFVDTSPVIQSYHQEKWASLPGEDFCGGMTGGMGQRGGWGGRADGVENGMSGRMARQGEVEFESKQDKCHCWSRPCWE